MTSDEWNSIIVASGCLSVAVFLLIQERPVDKSEWLKQWVLARFLLLIAAVSFVNVWIETSPDW